MTTKCLPYGPPTAHILQSHGPDSDLHHFYITEYSSNYAQEGFILRPGKHQGTGYKSNFRPGVYYNRRLDELDNPSMGQQITDNYTSVTKKHFLPVCGSTGNDPFAREMVMRSSGFLKEIPVTLPRSHEVSRVFVDTARFGTVYPKQVTYLQKIQPKDPISLENLGNGPSYMSTETHSRYHARPNMHLNTSGKTLGRKEGSGFTHAYNDEPVTHRPKDAYDTSYQLMSLSRPTGLSVMKTSFLPSVHCDGNEKLPILPRNSERGTGYTRETMGKPEFYLPNKAKIYTELKDVPSLVQDRIRKQNPTEFLNMTNPNNKSSIASKTFMGLQHNHPTLAQRLENSTIGRKEDTGFTENNCQYFEHFETPATLNRFKTHYGSQFQDRNPKGEARFGRTAGHVMSLPLDGFTKSTKVNDFGAQLNTTKLLQGLEPYLARSIKARDPLFDDHTHDAKHHVTKTIHT